MGRGKSADEGSAWAQVTEQGECSGEVAGGETAGITQNGFGTRSQASWVPCWDSGPSVEAMGGHRQFWGSGDQNEIGAGRTSPGFRFRGCCDAFGRDLSGCGGVWGQGPS